MYKCQTCAYHRSMMDVQGAHEYCAKGHWEGVGPDTMPQFQRETGIGILGGDPWVNCVDFSRGAQYTTIKIPAITVRAKRGRCGIFTEEPPIHQTALYGQENHDHVQRGAEIRNERIEKDIEAWAGAFQKAANEQRARYSQAKRQSNAEGLEIVRRWLEAPKETGPAPSTEG